MKKWTIIHPSVSGPSVLHFAGVGMRYRLFLLTPGYPGKAISALAAYHRFHEHMRNRELEHGTK